MVKPWREIAIPHDDVLKGTFQQAEFAADLSRVHSGTATAEYQDPVLFFQRTFITEGMRLLLDSLVKRLTGRGGDPVMQLQTAFGGGKTHTMLAVYHIAKGEARMSDLVGIPPILDAAGVMELPKAKVAVLDGNSSAPNMPQKRGAINIRTLWGDLAWQLGRETGYDLVRQADESGTSPGKDTLIQLLSAYSPCVVLMDELVAYIRQFEEGKSLTGGNYGSNLSFIQALTEAVKAAPNAMLLASLPESDREAGSIRGVGALRTLEHYFARVQALWKPVATEEAFEIVRRRLFSGVRDKADADAVCRSFADYYCANGSELPRETQQSRYFDRLTQAYPIHPEVFDRLYEDWSSLDSFQRTRGVLKLMAKVIHRLWKDGNNDLLIMPGNLPLYDADTRNELVYYLPQGWDPVVEKDIDGERAETTEIENKDTRFGAVQACRRTARTVFLGSAPSTQNQMVRGLESERVILGSVQPGQQVGIFRDALRRLTDRLHYLNSGNSRFWFDTRPNLLREMEERKRRFDDKEHVFPAIKKLLESNLSRGVFAGVHISVPSSDIPDDGGLRLVALSPETPFSRQEERFWRRPTETILKLRGDQPRQKQNRLLFLAADYDNLGRFKEQIRSVLAWESIVEDYAQNRIILDNIMGQNAAKALQTAKATALRMMRETYKWILAPMQEAIPGKGVSDITWEYFQINPGAPQFTPEIERVLKENEILITEWSPIHLNRLLKTWFWKDTVTEIGAMDIWQKTCCYLYLPRLKDSEVYRATVSAGASSRDFFGFAYGKEDGGKYTGFSFGKAAPPILDGSLLLIEPSVAAAYEKTVLVKPETPKAPDAPGKPENGGGAPDFKEHQKPLQPGGGPPAIRMRRFYGSIDLDAILAKKQFADLVDEVVIPFTAKPGVKVRIAIEIQAETEGDGGFDDSLQRTVKENCNVLRFKNAEFED